MDDILCGQEGINLDSDYILHQEAYKTIDAGAGFEPATSGL
jgi:hypothetical protein